MYQVFISETAESDLTGAVRHIEHVLLNPGAAEALLKDTENAVSALSEYPDRFPLADDPVLKVWGLHIMPLKNYLVFYTVRKEPKRVDVVRFLYCKRDWLTIIKTGVSSR